MRSTSHFRQDLTSSLHFRQCKRSKHQEWRRVVGKELLGFLSLAAMKCFQSRQGIASSYTLILSKNKGSSFMQYPRYASEVYSYNVIWSPDDKAFIRRVLEFSSLAAHGSTQEKALREIRSVVKYAPEDLTDSRDLAPEPLSKRSFSGTLNVRGRLSSRTVPRAQCPLALGGPS